ncbi:hypothetical protein A0H81_13840 [Grifola frondosa]|uniref:Uncharacterized protein n=1 Tax=Grifola frondosa TaxID=5627 RepID=A0A1C7LN84_GRIFR|nr:hypothetical protein A0H81_13840 [Grifola frondosa]
MVDRAILQKLHGLQTEDPDEHRNPNKPLNSDEKPRWPPIVTALPEARIASSSSTHLAGVSTEALDAQFCESAPCRLLLPLSFPEREPKAQVHLAHVLSLARSLNRTLILPNVGHGRVGACQKWEFDAYFDIASIVRTSGASVMMMDDFKTWVDMRPKKPDAQIIVVDEIATEEVLKDGTSFFGDGVNVDVGDMQDGALKGVRCLKSRFRHMRLDGFSPLSAHLISSDQHSFWSANSSLLARALTREDVRLAAVRHNQATGDDLALDAQFGLQQEPLQSPSSASDPEVFLLQWDSHQIASSATTIEYSSKLWTLADKLVASLGTSFPYTGTWREFPRSAPGMRGGTCGYLDALLLEGGLAEGLRTVWIASDYPSHSQVCLQKLA